MMMICWTGDATTDDPPTGVKVHIVHSIPVYVSCTVVDNAFICHSGNIVIPLANEWIPLSFAVVCLVERHTGTKKKKRKSPPRVSRIKPSVSWHISSSSLSWWWQCRLWTLFVQFDHRRSSFYCTGTCCYLPSWHSINCRCNGWCLYPVIQSGLPLIISPL